MAGQREVFFPQSRSAGSGKGRPHRRTRTGARRRLPVPEWPHALSGAGSPGSRPDAHRGLSDESAYLNFEGDTERRGGTAVSRCTPGPRHDPPRARDHRGHTATDCPRGDTEPPHTPVTGRLAGLMEGARGRRGERSTSRSELMVLAGPIETAALGNDGVRAWAGGVFSGGLAELCALTRTT